MGLFGSQPLVDLNRGPQMDPLDVNVPRRPNAGDWFFSPDQSTTRGKLGLLGEYLMGASGSPLASLGNGLLGMRQQGQANEDMELDRELKRAQIGAAKNKSPQMSNAARMAQEMGLTPGTAEYANFIRRYAFKPMVLQVPNAMGGTDFQEYDPSGASQGRLQPGHVEDGFRYNGGDPANPSSWSEM